MRLSVRISMSALRANLVTLIPLSDTEVFRTLLDALCVPGYADEFDAGYATGWIEALIQDRDLFALPLA